VAVGIYEDVVRLDVSVDDGKAVEEGQGVDLEISLDACKALQDKRNMYQFRHIKNLVNRRYVTAGHGFR
jgi:hypothetical protein